MSRSSASAPTSATSSTSVPRTAGATPGLAQSAQLYLCTDARERSGDFADFVRSAYSGGVDIIQLRDKSLEAQEELRYAQILAKAAAEFGALWALNDRADIAKLSQAPVFHGGQLDLTPGQARSILGNQVCVGLSTHTPEQIDAALQPAAPEASPDYFCVGPIWATPTKPGRKGVGLELIRYASRQNASLPWFGIGGIDLENIDEVLAAGASRVVVVRAITESAHPESAARALKTRLKSHQ